MTQAIETAMRGKNTERSLNKRIKTYIRIICKARSSLSTINLFNSSSSNFIMRKGKDLFQSVACVHLIILDHPEIW